MPKDLRSRSMPRGREQRDDEDDLLEDEFVVVDGEDLPMDEKRSDRGIRGDKANIAVLLFLYILQGVPLGLSAAIPLILTNRHVSYKEQAEFSFSTWPFSVKLVWAPLVDSCFISSFGRRKTWLVPVQYLIGLTMLIMSGNIRYYLGEESDGPSTPNVFALTATFFFLNFLAATQDIAVDGWALTMLQRHNVGYASACNTVGQTAGYFLGFVLYIGLESYGLVTLSGFLFFWGLVFLMSTTLVAIFKHEKSSVHHEQSDFDEHDLGIVETYKLLYKILRLPLVPVIIFVLLTCKIGFSATDSVTGLKLIENGVPKDKLAMLSVPMIPLQILLPLVISHYIAGPKPMDIFLRAMPPRLLVGLVMAWAVYVTPTFQLEDGQFPYYYYILIVGIYLLHQVCSYSMFVSVMAFFARISDPAVGGTYMTLLNTVCNLGGNWPATLALWCVDFFTTKECVGADGAKLSIGNMCDGAAQTAECEDVAGGKCHIITDGYYIETAACCTIGFLWLLWGWGTIKRLQEADVDKWRVVKQKEAKA